MRFYTFGDFMRSCPSRREPLKDPNAQYKSYWAEGYPVSAQYVDEGRPVCPVCGRKIGSLRWAEPRKFRIAGTRYPDRLHDWMVGDFVVSERFRQKYEEEHLTGVSGFLDMEVVRLTKRQLASPPPKYYIVDVPYSECVQLDMKKSIITGSPEKSACTHCWPIQNSQDHVEKIVLDAENWDGTDIFRVYALGIVMSQRMHDIIENNNLTNFDLVSIDDYWY